MPNLNYSIVAANSYIFHTYEKEFKLLFIILRTIFRAYFKLHSVYYRTQNFQVVPYNEAYVRAHDRFFSISMSGFINAILKRIT